MSDKFTPIADPRPVDSAWPQASWPPSKDAILVGRTIELRRTTSSDAGALHAALSDPAVWTFLTTAQESREDWDRTLATTLALPNFCQWTVVLREEVNGIAAGTVVGTTAYLDTSAPDARTEIGFTMYDPRVWATRVNPEAKLLLLRHAFEVMNMGRVQLKTDVRNVRSQQAISRLGAVYEGVRRRYQRRADGSVRDTVVFSIVAEEWPRVRDGLIERLGGDPQEQPQEQ